MKRALNVLLGLAVFGPLFLSTAFSSKRGSWRLGAQTIGCRMPNRSVRRVLITASRKTRSRLRGVS
jgi:hypothetical protein